MKKEKLESKSLFLLDGSALAYRAHFAFLRNPLINSQGIQTGGVFGFTNSLLKILRDENPDYLACVFDTPAPTFRHKAYAEYKATREKMPQELVEQLPLIREVVDAFNIAALALEGYEADDLIGTLARKAESMGMTVSLVTGDKDLMQLVSDRVRMYTPGKGEGVDVLGPEEVKEKLGVLPEKVTDFLGLTGDASDNVPGVPGVGPKTALTLLESYGSLETVLERAGEVQRDKLRQSLLDYKDQAILSKNLVTLDTHVPLEITIESLALKPMDREKVVSLFHRLEFSRFLKDLAPSLGKKSEHPRNYKTILETKDLDSLIAALRASSMFSVDLETTSLDPISAKIVGISFSWEPGLAAYVPVLVQEKDRKGDLFQPTFRVPEGALGKLKPLLEDPRIRKCGQNIKYDMLVLERHGVNLQGIDFDSMVAAYLVNPSARQYGIDTLALEYLHEKKIPTKDLIGTGKSIDMSQVELDRISEYACEDADTAYRLRLVLEPMLKESNMELLFQDLEMPLVRVLAELEKNGVALDTRMLKQMSADMERQLDELSKEIYDLAGGPFNINSTQQLGAVLYERLKVHELSGFKRPKKTKTGYATDVAILETLTGHPLPRKILDYRQFMKLKSTYVDALPRLINPETGRLHASFNQAVTTTGRLSSSDPNLQNIPVRTEMGREIRKAFVPGKPGWVILSADYSQIELRIMAHLSGDETLIDSFRKGEDVHRRTACEIFGLSPSEVTEDHRRQAKTINFGIMYGMGPYGLSQRLGIGLEEAQRFIASYFARYPKVNAYIAETIRKAHEQGYVTTLMQRRRYLPELKSDNRNIREFGERTAVNTPIQGTAADLIKLAMLRIAEKLRAGSGKAMMILQIHDELVFEVPEPEADGLTRMVRKEMEGALSLSVPIGVDVGVGKNWLEAH